MGKCLLNKVRVNDETLWKKKQKATTEEEKQEIQNKINELAVEIKKLAKKNILVMGEYYD